MPPITTDRVPSHFPAGTTVQYSRSLDNFLPSDGWTYTIYLNGLTVKFNKAATVQDDNSFLVTFLPSDTESLAPGPYRYAERLSKPATVFTLTQVAVDGEGNAIYSFSSFSGPAPALGAYFNVAGFTNAGNNISGGEITALGAGTFTAVNPSAVNETAAAMATVPAEVFDIRGDELVINVEPDAASSPAGIYQTFEEKTLAVIEAALSGNLSGGMQSYQIAGRAVSKYNLDELAQLRGRFRAAVWRQHNPGRLGQAYDVEFTAREETQYPPTWVDVTGLDR
jgi:hypothetical protein